MMQGRIAMTVRTVLVLLAASVVFPAGGQEPNRSSKLEPPARTENKNTLIKTHRDKLKLSCSTFFGGWPVERIIDGDEKTSWFSDSNDSVGKGTKPWVQIEFPEDVTVARVSILGNREPEFPKGFSIVSSLIEFFDADGKKIWSEEGTGAGIESNFEFKPKNAVAKVRSIRFTSLKDQGDQNPFGDVAIAEVQVE